jgi:hypothetical protein
MENQLLSHKVIILRLLKEKLNNYAWFENFQLQVVKLIMTDGIQSHIFEEYIIFLGLKPGVKYAICPTLEKSGLPNCRVSHKFQLFDWNLLQTANKKRYKN